MTRALASALLVACVLAFAPSAHADCPEPAVSGIQPCDDELKLAFGRAATNTLGDDGPPLGSFGEGRPSHTVSARFPCALLAAMGQVESSWRQFESTGMCGGEGDTLISFDCGYGVMQITSGMTGGAGFDPPSVARDMVYNVGTGALALGQKWHVTPYVGDNNPDLIECWYFAVWAYNGYSYINNPNNPRYSSTRMPYRSSGGGARGDYPYQEIVWGYLRTPVADRWPAIEVSFPDNSEICTTSSCGTVEISQPLPAHTGACGTEPMLDGGIADASITRDGSIDDASIDDASTDAMMSTSDGAVRDAGATDAGTRVTPPKGCACATTQSSNARGIHLLCALFVIAIVTRRSRARRHG